MGLKISEKTPGDEIVEQGVGLVARGVFRLKEREGLEAAIRAAQAAQDTIRGVLSDFRRLQVQQSLRADAAAVERDVTAALGRNVPVLGREGGT
jgi:hypothetical protein